MTKALHCRKCNSVHTFKQDRSITSCDCGKVQGWWHDPDNGLAFVYTPDPADRELAHVISLHNGYLNDGPQLLPTTYYDPHTQKAIPYPQTQIDTFWRQMHANAVVTPRAPETVRIFDQSRRQCWATIIEPGTAVDVQWATPEQVEYQERQSSPA